MLGVFKFRPFLEQVFHDNKRGATMYSTIDVASLRIPSNFTRRSYTYRYSVRLSLNTNRRLLMMLGVCKLRKVACNERFQWWFLLRIVPGIHKLLKLSTNWIPQCLTSLTLHVYQSFEKSNTWNGIFIRENFIGYRCPFFPKNRQIADKIFKDSFSKFPYLYSEPVVSTNKGNPLTRKSLLPNGLYPVRYDRTHLKKYYEYSDTQCFISCCTYSYLCYINYYVMHSHVYYKNDFRLNYELTHAVWSAWIKPRSERL